MCGYSAEVEMRRSEGEGRNSGNSRKRPERLDKRSEPAVRRRAYGRISGNARRVGRFFWANLAGRRVQMGHSRHFDGLPMTSGLPPEADVVTARRHVSKVPGADIPPCGSTLGRNEKKGQWAIYCRPPAKASRSSRRRSLPAGGRHRSAAALTSAAAAHPKTSSPRSE